MTTTVSEAKSEPDLFRSLALKDSAKTSQAWSFQRGIVVVPVYVLCTTPHRRRRGRNFFPRLLGKHWCYFLSLSLIIKAGGDQIVRRRLEKKIHLDLFSGNLEKFFFLEKWTEWFHLFRQSFLSSLFLTKKEVTERETAPGNRFLFCEAVGERTRRWNCVARATQKIEERRKQQHTISYSDGNDYCNLNYN